MLTAPDVTFWSVWEGDEVVGVGALRRLTADHGEIKSMYTAETARGKGVASALLEEIVRTARARGMSRISLEKRAPGPTSSRRGHCMPATGSSSAGRSETTRPIRTASS